MENKDFRDRLRNHTSPSNPQAWEQMQQLLDATRDEKKNKRWFFWIFFFGLCIGMISFSIWYYSPASTALSQKLPNSKQNIEFNKKQEVLINEDRSESNEQSILSQGDLEVADTSQQLTELSKNQNKVDQTAVKSRSDVVAESVNDFDLKNKTNSDNKRTIAALNERTRKKENVELSVKYGDDTVNDTEVRPSIERIENRKKVDDDNRNLFRNEKSDKKQKGNSLEEGSQADTSLVSAVQNSNLTKELEISTEIIESSTATDFKLRPLLESVGIVPLQKPNPLQMTDLNDFSSPSIKIIKPSRFHGFVGGGYALFNDNPGFIILSGIRYDVDRILDIEGNLTYSYGSDRSQVIDGSFEYENEIDLSILFHLNFIKTTSNKFSFLAGAGHTRYRGQRVIGNQQLDIRSSSGRNLQVGFAYQYNWNADQAIGFRFGAIIYDDTVAYFAPFYMKRF